MEFIDGGYDPTELNEKKEEYKQEAKRMRLKEGRIYSYHRYDDARALFRYDGIKVIEEFMDSTPSIRFQVFGYRNIEPFTTTSLQLKTLQLMHAQRGLKRADRKATKKFRREWAKSMLQTS